MDHEIVAAVLAGHTKEFEKLVNKYQARLECFVTKFFQSSIYTGDIVQETFLTAYQELYSLRDHYRFKTWLYGIAYRKCVQLVRRHKQEVKAIQSYQETYQELDLAHNSVNLSGDQDRSFLKLLDKLPTIDALLIWLHYIEDLPYHEIAEMIEMNEATIRQRCRRALVRLRGLE